MEGLRPIDLGQTADGMLGRRMLSVVGALVRLGGMAEHIRHANVILARNLEIASAGDPRAKALRSPGRGRL